MVLVATENIVNKEGFKALTVRKIAMEIGYTVGSIYMVFENMDDLIIQVKGRVLDDLAESMESVELKGSAEQKLQTLATAYLQFAHVHYSRWRMIFDVYPASPLPEWYQQRIQDVFLIVEQLFRSLSPEQSAKQVQLAARSLWCGVHGVCELSLNGSLGRAGADNAETTVGMLVDNFIRGWKQAEPVADTKKRKK